MEKTTKTISYTLQFINSTRFMAINLAQGLHEIKCKNEHDIKKCRKCGT